MNRLGIGLGRARTGTSGAGTGAVRRKGNLRRPKRPMDGPRHGPWRPPGPAVRRPRVLRRIALAAILGVAGHLAPPERALADDFDLLLQSAGSEGTVSALVTGWRAITGDEASLGSRGDGPVAITGDEFVQTLEGASSKLAVTRRYENFPVHRDRDGRTGAAGGEGARRAASRYGTTRCWSRSSTTAWTSWVRGRCGSGATAAGGLPSR